MDAAEELLTLAEIAIGLAGFSGVVVAFSRGSGLHDIDRFYFVALLTVTLSAFALAFVPFGFHRVGYNGPALWMASSAAMLATAACVGWSLVASIPRELRAEGVRGRRWHKNVAGKVGDVVSWGLPALIAVLQVANIGGWPMESDALFYVAGLVFWLLIAGMNFFYLVVFGASR